jgi:hypothetical protein
MNISEFLERSGQKAAAYISARAQKSQDPLSSSSALSCAMRERGNVNKNTAKEGPEKKLKSREGSNPPELFARNKTAQRR